jgi:SAM-dependent methyltransferase
MCVETGRETGAGALPPIEPIARLPGETIDALRAAVVRSGYSYDTLAAAERVAPMQLDAVRLPLVAWWLERRPGPDATLARLFTYQARVPIGSVAAALGDGILDALVGAGILAASGGTVEARLRLTPFEGLLLLSDPPEAGADAVMGPGPTTVLLARALPAAPGSVLDLGCGAGTLALLAASRGAPRAVGVDLSSRAISLARVNARLNASAAEFREGDLLAPVRGERFDLALSQPPYVPLPAGVAPTVYLHGGARGDELAVRFAAALPAALAPGGRAVLLYDAPATGRPLHETLRAALGEAPADLVVLAAPGPSADLQAVAYAAVEDPALGLGYGEALRRYRDHLEALGGTTFTRALVILRASDRPAGRFTIELPLAGLAGLGPATIDRYLAALDLAGAPDAALLAARVRAAPELRIREERRAGPSDAPPALSVRFEPGWIGTDRQISAAGAFLLDALSAAASVEEAAARFAETVGEEAAAARPKVLAFVREGLSRGLLAAG